MRLLLFLLLAQDADLETLVAQLDQDDAALREKASADLIKRGPEVVPRLLELQRGTTSGELRARAEDILCRYPFEALVRTRDGEPLRAKLSAVLLKDLDQHRAVPGCWLPKEKQAVLDPARLTVHWQTGSGHGQFLALVRIASSAQGGLDIRRIAYQGTTPYRSQVKAEGVRAEESRFGQEESKALIELLQAGIALEPKCVRPQVPGRAWMSSGSFSLCFRIDNGDATVWSAAYTGYPGTTGEPEYAHGRILDDVLEKALARRTWTEAKILPEDRARALQWMKDHAATESWWIREHYLNMARYIGDETYRPFLESLAKELAGKDGPSEKRQQEALRDALQHLRPVEK